MRTLRLLTRGVQGRHKLYSADIIDGDKVSHCNIMTLSEACQFAADNNLYLTVNGNRMIMQKQLAEKYEAIDKPAKTPHDITPVIACGILRGLGLISNSDNGWFFIAMEYYKDCGNVKQSVSAALADIAKFKRDVEDI